MMSSPTLPQHKINIPLIPLPCAKSLVLTVMVIRILPMNLHLLCLIQLPQQLPNVRHGLWIELVYPRRVDGHTNPPCLWVYAERRFEQVIPALGNFGVEA